MSSRLTRFAVIAVTLGIVSCSPKPSNTAGAPPASTPAAAPQTAISQAGGQPPTPSANMFSGAITETMNSGGYTYMHLQKEARDVWAAGPEFDAKVGEVVAVSLEMPMQNFESKTLKRTFPLLYFVAEVARNGQEPSSSKTPAAPAMATGHGADRAAVVVEKLQPPAGGLSIADVFAKQAALSGKSVTVRGKVVKFNGGIMDRNWLHIQDGSGTTDAHNNDLTVTTDASVKVGDVVTLTGVLGTNKDFGSGYAYDAILEKAVIGAN
jgi:hypothetical protein